MLDDEKNPVYVIIAFDGFCSVLGDFDVLSYEPYYILINFGNRSMLLSC